MSTTTTAVSPFARTLAKVAGRGLESLNDEEFEEWSDFVEYRPDLASSWRTPRDSLAVMATRWEAARREGRQISAVLIAAAKPLARRLRADGTVEALDFV